MNEDYNINSVEDKEYNKQEQDESVSPENLEDKPNKENIKNVAEGSNLTAGGDARIGDTIFNIMSSQDDKLGKILKNKDSIPQFDEYKIKKPKNEEYLKTIDLNENVNCILKNSILLVCSYEEDIVLDANNAVLVELKKEHDFDIKFLSNSDLNESFDFPLLAKTIREFKNSIIVFDIRIRSFYESIFKIGKQDLGQILANLKDRKVLLLLSLTYQKDSRLIENFYQKHVNETNFPVWDIDFITPLFNKGIKEYSNKHEEYKRLLLLQKETGLWDKSTSKEAFYLELKCALNKPDSFINTIEQDVEEAKSDAENRFDDVQKLFEIDELFEAIGLMLSQFKNLNLGQLDYLLEKYLKHLDTLSEPTVTITETDKENENKEIVKEDPIKLFNRWNKEKKKQQVLFDKLQLESRKQEDNKRIIEFKNALIKSNVKDHFNLNESFQLRELWEVFKTNHILFDKIDINIIEGIVLLIDKLIQDFGFTISNDYLSLVYSGILKNKVKISNKERRINNFQGLIENYDDKIDQLILENRLILIIAFFYEKENLKKTVLSFLSFLIKNGHFNLQIRIIDSLKYYEDFDELLWIKYIFSSGSSSSKESAFSYLLHLVHNTSSINKVVERCEYIRLWLKNEDEDSIDFINSIAVSHHLLQLNDIVNRLPTSNYGLWPKEYPLFLFTDLTNNNELLNSILQWLFDDKLNVYFNVLTTKYWKVTNDNTNNKLINFNIDYIRCRIIQHWFIFLTKKNNWNGKLKNIPEEIQFVLSLIKTKADKNKISAFYKYLGVFRKMNNDKYLSYKKNKDEATYKKNKRQIKTTKIIEKVLKYLTIEFK